MNIVELGQLLKRIFRFVSADTTGNIRAHIVPRTGPLTQLQQLVGGNGEISVATDTPALVVQFPAAAGGTQVFHPGAGSGSGTSAADIPTATPGLISGQVTYPFPVGGNATYSALTALLDFLRTCTFAATAQVKILLSDGEYSEDVDISCLPNVVIVNEAYLTDSLQITAVTSVTGNQSGGHDLGLTYSGNVNASTGYLCMSGNSGQLSGAYYLKSINKTTKTLVVSGPGQVPTIGAVTGPAGLLLGTKLSGLITLTGGDGRSIAPARLGGVALLNGFSESSAADTLIDFSAGPVAFGGNFPTGTRFNLTASPYFILSESGLTLGRGVSMSVPGGLYFCCDPTQGTYISVGASGALNVSMLGAVGATDTPLISLDAGAQLNSGSTYLGYASKGIQVNPGSRALLGMFTQSSLTNPAVSGTGTSIPLNTVQSDQSVVIV